MGNCCSCGESLPSIVFLGLCDSGKTSIVEYIEYHTFRLTHPTLGVKVSTAIYQDKRIEIWDVSGRDSLFWSNYYHSSSGIVFVLDCSNPSLFDQFFELTNKVLDDKTLEKIPILIYINRILENENEIINLLNEKLNIKERINTLKIQISEVKNGLVINEGFNCLMSKIFI